MKYLNIGKKDGHFQLYVLVFCIWQRKAAVVNEQYVSIGNKCVKITEVVLGCSCLDFPVITNTLNLLLIHRINKTVRFEAFPGRFWPADLEFVTPGIEFSKWLVCELHSVHSPLCLSWCTTSCWTAHIITWTFVHTVCLFPYLSSPYTVRLHVPTSSSLGDRS